MREPVFRKIGEDLQQSAAQAFACVFLLVGTVLMAKSLGDIAGLPLEARRKRLEKKVLEQYGDHLDGEEFAEILRYAHSQGLCDSATSCSNIASSNACRSTFAL